MSVYPPLDIGQDLTGWRTGRTPFVRLFPPVRWPWHSPRSSLLTVARECHIKSARWPYLRVTSRHCVKRRMLAGRLWVSGPGRQP